MNNYDKIEELLESDDELPMDYHEAPTLPTYKLDNRFDLIQFKWINKSSLQSDSESNNIEENKIPCLQYSTLLHHGPILNKGVLNKNDLFCIKSIEGFTGEPIFIWLINFLLYKDLQANYRFLKSCLVSSFS